MTEKPPRGQVVHDQIEQVVHDQIEKAARARPGARPFMRRAGVVDGARDLSRRPGFSRS